MDVYSKFVFVGTGRPIEVRALKVISIKLGTINIEEYKNRNVVKDFKNQSLINPI